MDNWELISLDSDGFELQLNFTNPLQISAGEEPDLLLIQLNLSGFLDENEQKFPDSVVKYSPIPTQIASLEQAEKINDSGSAASSSSKASISSNFIVNILMAGSLNQVWAVIEGLQVVCHMSLFKLKSPGNVNAFSEFFDEIATLDFFDTSDLTNEVFYIPEMDAISLNFQNAGYNTNLLIPCLGLLFYVTIGLICLFFVHGLVYLLAKAVPKVDRLTNKLSSFLHWNGSIRFILEGYMDIVLFSFLNVNYLEWSDSFWSVNASNYMAITFTVIFCGLPIVFIIFYGKNMKRWKDKKF